MRGISLISKLRKKLSWAVSLWATPRHKATVKLLEVNSLYILANINEDVGRSIWLESEYEPVETAFWIRNIRPNDVCVDVGANIGYFTLLFSSLTAPAGRVFSFEPVQSNVRLMKASIELNQIKNVQVESIALADRDGATEFSVSTDGAYSSLVNTGRKAEAAKVQICMERFETYARKNDIDKIDILKVDVEGAEGLVIAGMGRFLERSSASPRIIQLELTDDNCAAYNMTAQSIADTVVNHGYKMFVVDTLSASLKRIVDLKSEPKKYNFIFARCDDEYSTPA
jgi:FkbM family methyltransferase